MKKYSVIRTILIIILAAIFLFSAGKVAVTLYHYQTDKNQYDNIRDDVRQTRTKPSEAETTAENETRDPEGSLEEIADKMELPMDLLRELPRHEHEKALSYFHTTFDYLLVEKYAFDFEALTAMNSDICGWIRIDGTNIDYPFVQTTNNVDYLRLGPDGKPHNAGTVFVDYRNKNDFSEKNTILYAHNQQNLQMFHTLLSYSDPAFLKEHPIVDIYLSDGRLYRYLIFASYETEENFPYKYRFATTADFQAFVDNARTSAYYDTGIIPGPEDKILTLVTCTKDFKESARIIVQAVLLTQE